MYQIMEKLDVDYQNMIEILKSDERVGWEHWKVPGPSPTPEGKLSYGFGGMCLPKDLSAFRIIAKQLGVNTKVLDAAWNKNLEVRPACDWENVPGVRKQK
jgi:UDP-glucose 6-dehydrogenase